MDLWGKKYLDWPWLPWLLEATLGFGFWWWPGKLQSGAFLWGTAQRHWDTGNRKKGGLEWKVRGCKGCFFFSFFWGGVEGWCGFVSFWGGVEGCQLGGYWLRLVTCDLLSFWDWNEVSPPQKWEGLDVWSDLGAPKSGGFWASRQVAIGRLFKVESRKKIDANEVHSGTPPKFNSSPLKNGGWKTIVSFWVSAYVQGRTVKLRGG